MNLFKRIFGNKNDKQHINEKETVQKSTNTVEQFLSKNDLSTNSPQLFKSELYDSLKRYYAAPDINPTLNLTDDKGEIYEEYEAFNTTYEQWKGIRSIWDRRSVLFSLWDDSELQRLEKWQVIERYVKDRYVLRAIDFQKNNIAIDDLRDIRLIVALSKLYRAMNSLSEALYYAEIGYKLRPDLDIVKTEYANVLHLFDSEDDKKRSHELINEVIENKIKKDTAENVALLNYFVFSENYIDSSIFTILYLNIGNCDAETWDKLAEEYYWCPNFRYEHSVFLSNSGDSLHALAKLNSLANEFPWYKTAVLANIDIIGQFRTLNNDPNFMNEELKQMEKFRSMWKN